MYRNGVEVNDEFKRVNVYSAISEKTVGKCGWCLRELDNAAEEEEYEL